MCNNTVLLYVSYKSVHLFQSLYPTHGGCWFKTAYLCICIYFVYSNWVRGIKSFRTLLQIFYKYILLYIYTWIYIYIKYFNKLCKFISVSLAKDAKLNVNSLTKYIKNSVTSGNENNVSYGGLERNKSNCRTLYINVEEFTLR